MNKVLKATTVNLTIIYFLQSSIAASPIVSNPLNTVLSILSSSS